MGTVSEAQRSYQEHFLKILRAAFEDLKPIFGDWLKREKITFEDIASVACNESSLGYDTKLCMPGHNPFELKGLAILDAINEATKLGLDSDDIREAVNAYDTPVCEVFEKELRITLTFHRRFLKGILKAFLLYLHRISQSYSRAVPNIKFCTRFEDLILTYYIGPNTCAKQLEDLPFEEWDEATKECLGYPAKPSKYLLRIRTCKEYVKDFFG